jgi:hypothetical protein
MVAIIIVILSLEIILFIFFTNITSSYAQLLQPGTQAELVSPSSSPKPQPQQNTPATSSPSSSHSPPSVSVVNETIRESHAVRITYPAKGQQVPIGKDVRVSGISLANATSHCQVSVMLNGKKPYQPATATGPGGPTDYSKWKFVLTSKYATIKQGPNNKITAKYICSTNPSGVFPIYTVSFYNVKVTGI